MKQLKKSLLFFIIVILLLVQSIICIDVQSKIDEIGQNAQNKVETKVNDTINNKIDEGKQKIEQSFTDWVNEIWLKSKN